MQFMELINSFNAKQYTFFLYIMQQQLHNENQQTLVCLNGGAKTEKSHVLKSIYEQYDLISNIDVEDRLINGA